MKYRSVQFTIDGEDWIFDYEGNTPQEVWGQVNDQGSKWIFYPIPFVVRNIWGQDFAKSRIIDTPDGADFLRGKTINTAREALKSGLGEALIS